MTHETFSAETGGETLRGWVRGEGTPVLLLHGGPGLSFGYLEQIAADIGTAGFRVAAFQQRGLEPSTLSGPFTIDQAIGDVVAVLDALGWKRALLVGHSWGGSLVLFVAGARPERMSGGLAIDPIGLIGDGGIASFAAEMAARLSPGRAARVREIDRLEAESRASAERSLEGLSLYWSAYFADPAAAPKMPEMRLCTEANQSLIGELALRSPAAASRLADNTVPLTLLAGASSPIPWGQACQATANVCACATVTVVQGAGHFPWHEAPGCVRAALLELHGRAASAR
ncbi:MAG: alpha/beta fold hydrolase [Solirubrobacteraceae bacterium]